MFAVKEIVNTVIQGDVMDSLKKLPDESIHCVITSPPYWQLRDYGWEGQWGLEKTFEDYLEHLWVFMNEIRRVLRPDGTAWINLGDTYGTQSGTGAGKEYISENTIMHHNNGKVLLKGKAAHKNQLLIPHRFAIGCSERGWIIRNDIIWAKPNSMPESTKDRFSKKHEYIFLMSKNPSYYFDLDAVRDPYKESSVDRSRYTVTHFNSQTGNKKSAFSKQGKTRKQITINPLGKNPGTVSDFWEVSNRIKRQKHYAQYNEGLIIKPILAGCPKGGIVLDPFCGTGTTGEASIKLGRNFIGIEGKKEFCLLARENLKVVLCACGKKSNVLQTKEKPSMGKGINALANNGNTTENKVAWQVTRCASNSNNNEKLTLWNIITEYWQV